MPLYKAANGWEFAVDIPHTLAEIRGRTRLSQERLAQVLGVSFVSVNRWERGASTPSPAQAHKIAELHGLSSDPWAFARLAVLPERAFMSRGVRRNTRNRPQGGLFADEVAAEPHVTLSDAPLSPILQRIMDGRVFANDVEHAAITALLRRHEKSAPTCATPPDGGMSAGKNTYTYDAHTYHTKVPPQGIAELLKHYLPEGGLVLDPFAGSGMTGVATRVTGLDAILNELSPAACFIANRFTSRVQPSEFEAAVYTVLERLRDLRAELYTTTCRECGRATEILYTVWSYNVLCSECGHEFLLWDHCRKYGRRVRDHKILTEFPCPSCGMLLSKRRLKRTIAEPVQIGYMCCGSRQQEVTHPLNQMDLELIYRLQLAPPVAQGFFPTFELPDGVNLRQPRHHGINSIDRFYTPRNLAAMSHLWQAIHRVEDPQLAAHLAFVFTSLYQRVTRLSEFRFWGGSGNTARFNVPFIFNEANVFVTFARKARTIQDHLESTATNYSGQALVIENSATALDYLPDESIDLIFTDPPFGANINYSEMNILWESWLQRFTNTRDEAIVNEVQGKDTHTYQDLMTRSLKECHRVLRPGHWLLLVFMNSSHHVWNALRNAVVEAGFDIQGADIFDKQHGTFKQFVSDNTAGCDLVLHCLKPLSARQIRPRTEMESCGESVRRFLETVDFNTQQNVFLHVSREAEIDFRRLYSAWTAQAILQGAKGLLNFAEFRTIILDQLSARGDDQVAGS